MRMKKYKSAIVGCGRIASLFSKDPLRKGIVTHAAAYKANSQTELVCACDIDEEKLVDFGKTWGVRSLYTNVEQMFKNENIDILSICTPPHTHYGVLKEAVKFPLKAIFCEKPLAENIKEAKEMVMICKKKRIILQVGYQRRFDFLHLNLRRIIQEEKLGKIQQANFYYTAGINNTGSHMFDLLSFFFGEAEWVRGIFSKNISYKDNDTNIDGMIKFKSGHIATFQAFDVKDYLIFELNCFFKKGRLVLKNSGFSLDVYTVMESKYFSGYKELVQIKTPYKTKYHRNFMVNAVKHLVECVRDNKESMSSGLDGLTALKLVQAAMNSAKNNGLKEIIR